MKQYHSLSNSAIDNWKSKNLDKKCPNCTAGTLKEGIRAIIQQKDLCVVGSFSQSQDAKSTEHKVSKVFIKRCYKMLTTILPNVEISIVVLEIINIEAVPSLVWENVLQKPKLANVQPLRASMTASSDTRGNDEGVIHHLFKMSCLRTKPVFGVVPKVVTRRMLCMAHMNSDITRIYRNSQVVMARSGYAVTLAENFEKKNVSKVASETTTKCKSERKSASAASRAAKTQMIPPKSEAPVMIPTKVAGKFILKNVRVENNAAWLRTTEENCRNPASSTVLCYRR